ncbi:MAG: Plug domain-containing protein, partial [Gemmatimonadota bacterium]|nr:Plug domain-containing protein [Gemmatimonadota bacterium]
LCAFGVLGLTAACAARQSADGPERAPAPRRVAHELITAAEIATAPQAPNAYEVVQTLRPMYLHSRGPVSIRNSAPAYPVVYLDNMRLGELESLRTIPSASITQIRYLSASDATTRWGIGHPAGVILVLTR